MKIDEIYKEKFVGKIKELNPHFYLFKKDVEEWNGSDWELWGKIVGIFHRLIYG